MNNLSERLHCIAGLVERGEPIADIGSDHAFLPIYLVSMGMVPWAVAGELGDGPYNRALQAIKQADLLDRIQARQGDGLQVLAYAEVSTIILAGLGGDNIAAILAHDWLKAASYKRFIFQPMSKAGVLRKVLAEKGWPILDEKLVRENEHYYPIIQSEPGSEIYQLDELEMEIGPKILLANDDIKKGFISSYVEKYGKVYSNLNSSVKPANKVLAQEYLARKHRLEVLLDASQSN